jgi:hypothetical protein
MKAKLPKTILCFVLGHDLPRSFGMIFSSRRQIVDGKETKYATCARCGREITLTPKHGAAR